MNRRVENKTDPWGILDLSLPRFPSLHGTSVRFLFTVHSPLFLLQTLALKCGSRNRVSAENGLREPTRCCVVVEFFFQEAPSSRF